VEEGGNRRRRMTHLQVWLQNRGIHDLLFFKRYDMEILVFKTNLSSSKHIRNVKPALNLHPDIKEWNVDLHDRDKVLRVVTENIVSTEVEHIIQTAGYICEELN